MICDCKTSWEMSWFTLTAADPSAIDAVWLSNWIQSCLLTGLLPLLLYCFLAFFRKRLYLCLLYLALIWAMLIVGIPFFARWAPAVSEFAKHYSTSLN